MNILFEHNYFKKFLLLILGSACIFYATSLLTFDDSTYKSLSGFGYENWYLIALSILLYMVSHFVRVIRLIILSPTKDIKIRQLIKEQYKANGVNLLFPFKLGEAYRFIYFKKFFGSYANSLAVLVCERLLDLIVISTFLAITIYLSEIPINEFKSILLIALCLILVLLFILFILDEILDIINQVIVQKETTKRTIQIIAAISNINKAIKKIKIIFSNKLIPCIVITMMIWILEILVFYLFLGLLENRLDLMILLALAVSLSSLLPGGPLGYGAVQIAFYLIGLSINFEGLVDYSIIYSLFIFGSGLIVASCLFFLDLFENKTLG